GLGPRALGMQRLPARRDPRLYQREPGTGLLPGDARPRATRHRGLRRRRAVQAARRAPEGLSMSRFLPFVLALTVHAACAQPFPAKPIRLVAPFAPARALDLIARGVGAKLPERTGHPVIVETRAGAAGA